MLVPFVIDADSLTPDQAWTPATVRQCHRDLLDVWRRIGLLVHDGERFEDSGLCRAVEGLPQHLRLLWQAMLKRTPPISCRNGWDGMVTPKVAEKICSVASIALVDDTRAEADFGLSEDQDETALRAADNQRLVICRLLAANHATVFIDAMAKSERHIEAGEGYQAIWDTRFRSLATAPTEFVKKVSIVDRYAVEQHFRCPQQWLSGLERFLRLLDEDAGGARHVTLFSAWTQGLYGKSEADVNFELDRVMQRLPKRNISRIKVCMVPNAGFRDDARDRFVRFGPYVWDLGHGLDVFEGPAAGKRCSASFKAEATSYEKVEKDLADHPKASSVSIHVPK